MQLLQYIAAEQAQSQFAPEAFELTIGRGGDVPPVHIPLPDGGSIEIAGKIDRVDCYTHGGETFVRVIDYKTGAKKFALSDVLYGINMQMLLYLMTLQQNGLRGRTVQPAGVLYLPARTPRINADHLTDGEARMSALMKEMKMNGMVLRDGRLGRGAVYPGEAQGGRDAGRVCVAVYDGAVRADCAAYAAGGAANGRAAACRADSGCAGREKLRILQFSGGVRA